MRSDIMMTEVKGCHHRDTMSTNSSPLAPYATYAVFSTTQAEPAVPFAHMHTLLMHTEPL